MFFFEEEEFQNIFQPHCIWISFVNLWMYEWEKTLELTWQPLGTIPSCSVGTDHSSPPAASQNKTVITVGFSEEAEVLPQVLVSEQRHRPLIFYLLPFLLRSQSCWSGCCNAVAAHPSVGCFSMPAMCPHNRPQSSVVGGGGRLDFKTPKEGVAFQSVLSSQIWLRFIFFSKAGRFFFFSFADHNFTHGLMWVIFF